MKIFLTGGTGYLGANLLNYLVQDSAIEEVSVLAESSESALQLTALLGSTDKIKFKIGSILTTPFDLQNTDLVIHLAARRGPRACERIAKETIEVNIEGTRRLVEAVKDYNVSHFIFLSTRNVYGDIACHSIAETQPSQPAGVYGITKYAGELAIRSLAASKTKFIILRPCRIYGYGIMRHMDDVTEIFAKAVKDGESLTIEGTGTQMFELIHIRDICECIMTLVKNQAPMVWNEIYNLSGGNPINIGELADIYIETACCLGLPQATKVYRAENSTAPPTSWLDIGKIKERVGWEPQVTLQEGISELILAAGKL